MNDNAAAIIIDAATADTAPSAFALTTALRAEGCNLKAYELLDRQLHIRNLSTFEWTSLDALAENLI